jgi:RHS repeat-associated protein
MRTFLVNETSENVWFDQFRIETTTPVILQETHYDPWGVELQGLGYQQVGIKANKYLYNGKEFNDHLGINLSDYGARMYDASIGRWFVVDPLAEIPSQIAHSPYAYAWNNPISMIDPTGMSAEECKDCPPPPGWDDPKKGKPMDEVVVSATRLDDSSTGMLSGRSGNSTWDNQRAQMGWVDEKAMQGGVQQAGFGFGDYLTSSQLAVAGLEPSFRAAAYESFKGGGKGNVPFFLKKDIFKSYKAVNNNAVRLGTVSSGFARNGAAVLKVAAPALVVTAVATNLYDIGKDGTLTWGDAFVMGNTVLQITFPVYGVIYGAADVGAAYFFGQSITTYTKDAIDSNTTGAIKIF